MSLVCATCGEENPAHARFCLACGAPLAAAPEPVEERKVVSVLFVDLVGFTGRSDRADPEDVRAILRPYHARMKQEIERFGGTIEKFVGDAVMAVFGAPVAHEDDAERAVRAALRILEAIDELNDADSSLELAVRAAVNTGEAVVSLGARPERGEGIATGDVVNTAARLQQAAPIGGLVVGEATYLATNGPIEYEEAAPVSAKGKAEPLRIWRATVARSRYGVDVEPTGDRVFVGREDDLTLLESTYARTMRESSIQLVTVTGEPGVGKTRLVAEFRRFVDDQPEIVFWRQGRCLPYGEGITYWALGEMVKAHAGILESDGPGEAAAKLELSVAAATEDESERDWLNAQLAPLIGVGDLGGVAPTEREESFTAWRRFLEGVASERPLILLFEDLHWADSALLEFVEHLVDWSTGVSLLVICTGRPELYELHPGWGGGKRNSTTISLAPLTGDETARLVASLLRQAVLPAETQTALLERCGGNPLYAEEFVRMLTDRGILTRQGAIAGNGEIPVPESVQALIAARLDTLPADRKALLHDAAVVGKVFWAGAVASMGGVDEAVARDGLHELAQKELVRPVRTSSVKDNAEYAFWHLLVRDVAYGQIPRAARARKHEAAARWIEQMAEDRVTDHAELLAHHYEHALELARAAGDADEAKRLESNARRFLILAGERARRLDVPKAERYYRRALALTHEDLERARLLFTLADLGQAIVLIEQDLQEALRLFRAAGDELGAAETLVPISWATWQQGRSARAEELLEEAIATLERHPPGPELLRAYRRKAGQYAMGSRPRETLAWSEQGLALANQLGRNDEVTNLLQSRGIARSELGDFPAGLQDLRVALDLALEHGSARSAGNAYSNLGTLVLAAEGPAAALAIHREGIDFAERRGANANRVWLTAETVWMLYDLGRWDELLQTVDDVAREVGPQEGQLAILPLPWKAFVLVRRGETAVAASLASEFLPRARDALDPQVLSPALAAAALAEQALGDLHAAVALVEEFDERLRERADWHRARFLPELVTICVAAGKPKPAKRLLGSIQVTAGRTQHELVSAQAVLVEARKPKQALALYEEAAMGWEEYGSVPSRADALFGAGRCLLALGRTEEAAARLAAAHELFEQLGARPALAEIDALLGDSPARVRI